MKNTFLLYMCLLISTVMVNAQDAETSDIKWLTDFNTAKELATTSKKPILMYFTGSDWCAPCKMLKEDFFHTDRFEKTAKQLVLLEVDIPRKEDVISPEQKEKNMSLMRTYNKEGGFPLVVALDNNGSVLGEISAYSMLRDPSKHFSFVESIIENH